MIVLEGAATKPAIRRSAEMFRNTWGENVLGNVGIGRGSSPTPASTTPSRRSGAEARESTGDTPGAN